MPEITIEVRDVYGQKQFYPVNDAAKTFAEIAGTKTLTPRTLALIRTLGYEVVVTTSDPLRAELERQGFVVINL